MFFVVLVFFLLLDLNISIGQAQVSTAISPTIGGGNLDTTVTANGHTVQITGGTRPDNGTNLFHSFDQFSLGLSDTAQFLNTTPSLITSNILGRVTGGNPSSILGTIDTSSYPGANLFLMNPAGIVFGPNATFSVSGSVALTTANYLRIAEANGSDAGVFHADPMATSILTSASVAAFGFLSSNPATIAVRESTLRVPSGHSLSLVGGNQGFTYTNPDTGASSSVPNGITITGGTLLTENGQVNIVSVASPGEILAGTLDRNPNINGQTFGQLGMVQISQQSNLDTSGEGGGTVRIRGGQLFVDDSTISVNTVGATRGLYTGPFGEGIDIHIAQDAIIDNGAILQTNAIGKVAPNHGSGGIRITADHIEISGGAKTRTFIEMNPEAETPFTGIRSNIEANSTASRSGDITLNATSIGIKELSKIQTQTDSAGDAGHIALNTSGKIHANLSNIESYSISENSSGDSGNITISSSQGNVALTDTIVTSQTGSEESGNAGRVVINAPQGKVLLDGAQVYNFVEGGTGILGGIQISARDLGLRHRTLIIGNNFGKQVAENIIITLDDRLDLKEQSLISTKALGPASAADLIIKASDIVITDGGALNSGTDSLGAGGAIKLSAHSLSLMNDGAISASTAGTSTSATGGSIIINATDHVTLTNGASITASTSGPGDAGNITINSDSLTVASGGRIEASTSGAGNGESITINTTGDVTVTGVSPDGQIRSGIFAKTLSAGGGNGNGGSGNGSGGGNGAAAKPGKAGDITIEAKNLFLHEGAQIDSSTTSGGPGGSVSIRTAENITIAGSSTRLTSDATRGDGKGGNITLIAKNITVHDRASVTAATGGKGDAGNISLTALDQFLLQSGGTITTSTSGSGKGGTVAIKAGRVVLDGSGTGITAATLPPFADMTVTIDILHPNDGDLVVQLDSPSGTRVALLSRVGGSGDNFSHTQFNDQATTKITSASAPFTGTFTPREPLGQLNKELAAGDWVLNVRDQGSGKVGTLESWTLQIGNQTFQSTGSSTVIPNNGNALRSTITVANPIVQTVPGVGEPTGIGGDISLTAGQSVTIQNGASISASSAGPGNAGTITIDAGRQLDVLNGSITTQAANASGGNIDIKAIDLIRVMNDGLISSSVQGGPSTAGGNITIDPKTVILQDSKILASAAQGSGGNITITTPLFLNTNSKVDASSQVGLNGSVTIQSPTSNLSGTVGQLASKTNPPQVLLQNRCVALASGEQSTFILAGRDTLPSEPGGWLSSPVAIDHWTIEGTEDHASGLLVQRHSRNGYPNMAAIHNETQTISLRRLTPPGFLVRTFGAGTTGCPS